MLIMFNDISINYFLKVQHIWKKIEVLELNILVIKIKKTVGEITAE